MAKHPFSPEPVTLNGWKENMPETLSELSPKDCKLLLNGLAISSRIFWGPDTEACNEMTGRDFFNDLMDLAGFLDGADEGAAMELAWYLVEFKDESKLCEKLEQAYIPCFINSPEGIRLPLYHSCYTGEGLLMDQPAQMMHRRFKEADILWRDYTSEPPDHLSMETEYLFMILEKAFVRDDPESLMQARRFARQDMLPWVAEFKDRIPREPEFGFYRSAATLLVSLLRLAAA